MRQSAPTSAPADSDVDYLIGESNNLTEEQMDLLNKVTYNDRDRCTAPGVRWYVSYYLFDKDTQKLKRVREYGFINREKCPDKRFELLLELYEKTKEIVKHGIKMPTEHSSAINIQLTTEEAILKIYKEKKSFLKKRTVSRYYSAYINFRVFMRINNLHKLHPMSITREHILEFRLFLIEKKIKNRTVNNYLSDLCIMFNYMIANYKHLQVTENHFLGLPKLPQASESNVAYSSTQVDKIKEYLQVKDKKLMLFCRILAYSFLRPNEIRLLQIKDIDLTQRLITLPAFNTKSNKRKTRYIIDTLLNIFKEIDLASYPQEYYLFSSQGKPGKKMLYEDWARRRFFRVKTKLKLGPQYTMYGFKHTFVVELLKNKVEWHEIMKLTGHDSMEAFQKYALSLFNAPSKDLSGFININF